MPTANRRTVPLDIRATFSERPDNLPPVAAYAFSRGGTLLDVQRLDKEGKARLAIPVSKEAQSIRVVLGPEVEKDLANAGEVLRRGGVDRHIAFRPDTDVPAVEFDVRPDIFGAWIGRLCVVRGTLVKRVTSGGISLRLPVCNAAVDIYEVDPWSIVIPRLPNVELDRLRDIVDGPWPPPRFPVPPRPPEIDVAGILPDPIGPRGLNPQPLPPRSLNPGFLRGFDPQPDPPRLAAGFLSPGVLQGFNPQPEPPIDRRLMSTGAGATVFPAALMTAARASRPVFERAVIDNLDLLRPILCWLYPLFVRKTKLATVMTDECGHFRAVIWRSIFNLDQPDLYFVARQRLWWGIWVTIYEPQPVACHTYWNYVCGSEVTLETSHPLVHTCLPCPPVIAPNNWVLFMAIGNSSVWRIHGANTTTKVGAPGHQASQYGLLDNSNPWGGTLRPRLEFDNSLRDSLGVKYYRVSFKRTSEPDSEWRPSTEAVNRHYTHEVAGDLILEQYPLGPTTVGASPHLYEISPALPPTGQWSIPNAVLDTQSAVIPTAAVAPGTTFDGTGTPVGTDQGGLWQIKVELFDTGGSQVDPEALGIKWRVPETADLTGTIQTEEAATLGLVNAAQNCMIVTVRVDNNLCAAVIGAPMLDGSAAADECGVMDYSSRSSTVTMPFFALQRNTFANYSFYVQRGAIWPPELSTSGAAATSAAAMPAAPTETVDNLLDTCNTAGFVEHLYVAHLATDGWSRQHQYDAHATRAFVLAPETSS
jgi:hypothetical protein